MKEPFVRVIFVAILVIRHVLFPKTPTPQTDRIDVGRSIDCRIDQSVHKPLLRGAADLFPRLDLERLDTIPP